MDENYGYQENQEAKQDGGSPYSNNMYSQPTGGYQQPMNNYEEPVSMGDWFLTVLALMIPCVGQILYIYWAFGSNVKKSKQNYCRVSLIFMVIGVVLYIILGVAIAAMMNSMSQQMMYY